MIAPIDSPRTADQLRGAGTTIALVSGSDRAVVSACRAGLVDILGTTTPIAHDILRQRWT